MSSTIQVILSPNIPIQVSLLQNLPFKIRVKEYPTAIIIPPPPSDIFAINLHATSTLYVGSNTSTSNVVITETTFKIGNSSVNTFINSSSISVTTANVSGNLSVSGITTLGGNIVFGISGLSANGSFGNPNQVLHSNGSATFWGPDDDASAYANGVIYTDNKTAQTYSNAVVYANAQAANAYSNAIAYAANRADTAFSNAAARADNAYSNATAYADNKAANAYSNSVSYTDIKAGNAYSNAVAYADAKAANAYSNAIAYSGNSVQAYTNATVFASNADNISSGTLNTARLPATVNISSNINVGANLNVNTSVIQIGNSTVNTSISAATITINGVNVNTAITSNAATAYSNATAYADTKAATAYSNATAYADTKAATAYSNAVVYANAQASNAYSNAVNYADSKAANAYSNAVSYTDAKAANAYTNATTFSSNADNITSGTLNTARLPATVNVSTAFNLGANVNVNTSVLQIGNSTVNTVVSAATITINGVNVNTAITSNAATAYSNATTFSSNADNITSGTLNTARLPATANLTTALNVGANVNVNTSAIQIGNSTVNTTISAATITINGVNVNTAITSNAATAYSNATVYADSKAATAYSNATAYADSKAATAFSNAATRADNAYTNAVSYTDAKAANAYSNATAYADARAANAYSNAVAYAASNTYVNSTFLPLAGGTLTGNLTINASANVVSNLAANNVKFRGDVQIDGNLTVSGTTVTISANNLSLEDNMIYLNDGSTTSNPDLGFAGNYNDGTYRHAGFFRDATDGIWKVFDGYTPEPDASPYIDTSNASFRIANFQANVITANSLTGNGSNITTINADNISSGTLNTARLPATVNVATALNLGANVNVNTSVIFVGNSTVNTSISAATITINGINVNTAITSNAATAYSNAIAYSGNAVQAYTNAITIAANADNITSGTLNTARLPATANLTTALNIGANVNANTSVLQIGNSTVNTIISAATITINGINVNTSITSNAATAYTNATTFSSNADNISSGTLNTARLPATVNVATVLNVGANVNVNTSVLQIGNSTVNTSISAATITINGINVNTAITSNAATAYSNATAYADTKAATAYSNAIAIAANATNLSSGTVAFARLPALYIGTTQIQSTSAGQAVSGVTTLAAGNTTITGFANVSSSLQVGGITTLNGNVAVQNYILANNASANNELLVGSDGSGFYFARGFNRAPNTLPIWIGGTTGNISFSTNGNEKLLIAANGNIGIANSAPASKLVIQDTLTANATSTFEVNPTWNATANTFTAIKVNVTDTASNTDSLIINAQKSGNSVFKLYKSGEIRVNDEMGDYQGMKITQGYDSTSFSGVTNSFRRFTFSSAITFGMNNIDTYSRSDSVFGWSTTTNSAGTLDFGLVRDVSVSNTSVTGVLGQRNSINPQTYRIYGTYTDASNYERLSLSANSSGHYVAAEKAGTGSARSLNLTSVSGVIILNDGNSQARITSGVWEFGNRYLTQTYGIASTNRTVVESTPVIDLSQTWNATANTFTAAKINITDTASNTNSLLMDLQVGGSSLIKITKSGTIFLTRSGEAITVNSGDIYSASGMRTGSGGVLTFNGDVTLTRDAANILAQRNSTNAQTLRVYGTFTDSSNYERVELGATATSGFVGHYAAGTGSNRNFSVNGAQVLLQTGATNRWIVTGSGHFTAATDNSFDIGASGANRPRDIQVARNIWADGNITGGGNAARVGTNGVVAANSVTINFSSTTAADGAVDVSLARDAADTLAQRRGTNAQAFRVYGTYTDASNYNRVSLFFSGNDAFLRAGAAGTGTNGSLIFGAGNGNQWSINTGGHLVTYGSDNTYDIGASGATRPRNLFVGGYGSFGTYAGSDLGAGGVSVSNHIVMIGSGSSRSQRAVIFGSSGGARRGAVSSEWMTNDLPVEFSNGSVLFAGFSNTGNFGIGNSSPDAKLAVTGTANVSGNVAIGGITTLNANITISSTSSLTANGSTGTAGSVLLSSGSAVYWGQNNIDGGTPFSVF